MHHSSSSNSPLLANNNNNNNNNSHSVTIPQQQQQSTTTTRSHFFARYTLVQKLMCVLLCFSMVQVLWVAVFTFRHPGVQDFGSIGPEAPWLVNTDKTRRHARDLHEYNLDDVAEDVYDARIQYLKEVFLWAPHVEIESRPAVLGVPAPLRALSDAEANVVGNKGLPSVVPDAAAAARGRVRGVIVVLCRNSDLEEMIETIGHFEANFNAQYGYPWVFLNNQRWSDTFVSSIRTLLGDKAVFGTVPEEHWAVPAHVNRTYFKDRLRYNKARGVMYGGSTSYRQMCRYYSGFFFLHPLLKDYDFYWRVEPGTQLLCNVTYDPFELMQRQNKHYGFVLALQEIRLTVPSLWRATLEFMIAQKVKPADTLQMFMIENGRYNLCHFWSNFEVGSFTFLRSPQYRAFFNHLDESGGFFYERWGDAPVHSIAAGIFLPPSQIHYFADIGYRHPPFQHCPSQSERKSSCECTPESDFALLKYGNGMCLRNYQLMMRDFIGF
eukprot:PhM_4_TR9432/c0_g1_i1/m.60109/K10967/KTR1_3; alpha 1,2-mannosyltransferase